MSKLFYYENERIYDVDGSRCEVEMSTPIDGVVRLIIVDGDGDATALELKPEAMRSLLTSLLGLLAE